MGVFNPAKSELRVIAFIKSAYICLCMYIYSAAHVVARIFDSKMNLDKYIQYVYL